jgi:hypothetical protein
MDQWDVHSFLLFAAAVRAVHKKTHRRVSAVGLFEKSLILLFRDPFLTAW